MHKLLCVLLCLALLPSVHAFGLAQDYLPNKTIHLLPGENATHNIELQNPHNQPLQINLSVDGKYAALQQGSNQVVTIDAQTLRTHIPIYLAVPLNATPDQHQIRFSAQPISTEQGMVGMGVRLRADFTLAVDKPPSFFEQTRQEIAQTDMSWVPTTLLVVLSVLALAILFKRSSLIATKLTRNPHAKSYKELIEIIDDLSEEEFQEFQSNNVLADWLVQETNHQALAKKLGQATTKQQAKQVITHEL